MNPFRHVYSCSPRDAHAQCSTLQAVAAGERQQSQVALCSQN